LTLTPVAFGPVTPAAAALDLAGSIGDRRCEDGAGEGEDGESLNSGVHFDMLFGFLWNDPVKECGLFWLLFAKSGLLKQKLV
jgi:hypothetical protein